MTCGGNDMNKRQAKKRYKKALELMKASRKNGIGVMIVNQRIVDKNGKSYDVTKEMQEDYHMVKLKRPQIRYFRQTKKNL